MDRELTLMAVHAHPDDEVIGTGGVLARYAEEGIRTVLVTCTNGEQGDGPGGIKPDHPDHDQEQVARLRLEELRESAAHLGVTDLELLGYRDSGMVGWATNEYPDAFQNVPLDQSAARLSALMERYRPQVVVTYDENGAYGHPDHIQAHRIALAATEATGIPRKLYYTAVPRSGMIKMFEYLRSTGAAPAEMQELDEIEQAIGTPDELITTVVDVAAHVARKRKALETHASQGENMFLLRLPEEIQQQVFGVEHFVRHISHVMAPDREDDLFAGLR